MNTKVLCTHLEKEKHMSRSMISMERDLISYRPSTPSLSGVSESLGNDGKGVDLGDEEDSEGQGEEVGREETEGGDFEGGGRD